MEDSTQFRNSGLKRILLATKFSTHGLLAAFKNEAAFRQEVILGLILVPLALWLEPGFAGPGYTDWECYDRMDGGTFKHRNRSGH